MMRNTVQRALVLETVRELQHHVTADEIYMAINKRHPDISRGTVYRNLNLLSDIGDIRKVEMPGGAALYDHIGDRHYHARCVRCGKVFDVEMEYIADLENSIVDTHGFVFTGHDIIFKGVCSSCAK
ncbi:MAG: transcriptional repressor [Oscillospiraceae bacterium]|nr:transcriptional repressor [Oscillospiraceae bacterium]